jgi:hypothetical protein
LRCVHDLKQGEEELPPEAGRFEAGKTFRTELVGFSDRVAALGTIHGLARIHVASIAAIRLEKRKFAGEIKSPAPLKAARVLGRKDSLTTPVQYGRAR